jgi:hypothetical protein
MRAAEVEMWEFEVAQTDLAILTPPSDQYFQIVSATVTAANSNSVDVSARLAFATTTIPAYTPNSSSGVAGEFFSHGGIARGGGWTQAGGNAVGDVAQPVRLTCSAPTGGSIRVIISFLRGVTDA